MRRNGGEARIPSVRAGLTRFIASDWFVASAILAALSAMTFSGHLLTAASPNFQHLGVEYYNIARAIADGRGFSDPFAEASSSTAWMPPLYPMLLAGLILLLEEKSHLAVAIVGLQLLSLTVIGLWCLRIVKKLTHRIAPAFMVPIYLIWIATFAFWFLMCTHDIWLVGLVVMALVACVHEYLASGRFRHWRWGLLGGLAATTSPAAAGAWFVLTLAGPFRSRHRWRAATISLIFAASLAAPWAIRNAAVFHQFIPVKSNLFFDAYQANCTDQDGIIDLKTTANHPHESLDARFTYARMGESQFMARHREMFLECLRRDPSSYLGRIRNRALAMTVGYVPFFEETWYGFGLRRFIYALPFVGLFLIWRGPNRKFVRALATLHGAYLCPYLFVTFHIRYFLPLTPVCVLVLFHLVDVLASRLEQREHGRPKPNPSAVDANLGAMLRE